jgi:hypothetical protein
LFGGQYSTVRPWTGLPFLSFTVTVTVMLLTGWGAGCMTGPSPNAGSSIGRTERDPDMSMENDPANEGTAIPGEESVPPGIAPKGGRTL